TRARVQGVGGRASALARSIRTLMVVRFSGRLWLRRAMTLALVVVGTSVAPLFGQQQPAQRQAFEAATIKLAERSASPLPVAPSAPNRLRIQSQTLTQLI